MPRPLKKCTKDELVAMCKKAGVKGYSKLKKDELVDLVRRKVKSKNRSPCRGRRRDEKRPLNDFMKKKEAARKSGALYFKYKDKSGKSHTYRRGVLDNGLVVYRRIRQNVAID